MASSLRRFWAASALLGLPLLRPASAQPAPTGFSAWAGQPLLAGPSDGTGGAAEFYHPAGAAVDAAGNVWVADAANSTIRRIAAGGVVVTIAGQAGNPGAADGAGSSAQFDDPEAVAVGPSGAVYVADTGNSTIRTIAAGTVATLAGQAGVTGAADGTGTSALFNQPRALAVDGAGDVYVADTANDTIRRITPAGVVTTLAGQAGAAGSADGAGAAARFNAPTGLALDGAGNLYVADSGNHTIRVIAPDGTVSTVAGQAGQPGLADGAGPVARFSGPVAVAVDADGDVYVADRDNSALRVIAAGGTVSTVALPAGSSLAAPGGLALDSAGNLYVSDTYNDSIRIASGAAPAASVAQDGPSPETAPSSGGGGSPSGPTTGSNSSAGSVSSGSPGSGASNPAPVAPAPAATGARLSNLSARAGVGPGANLLYVGFGVSGTGQDPLLVRAVGPTLAQFGVPSPLAFPQLSLDLANSTTFAGDNTGWGGGVNLANAFAQAGAFSLPPTSLDEALVSTLPSGMYVAAIAGADNSAGVALGEIYETGGPVANARLVNLSARAYASSGSDALIAGFTISGSGPETVLIRGIGPTLAQFGVPGPLANPAIALYDSQGDLLQSNAGWAGSPALAALFSQVGAFALPPASADAALEVTLQPGQYTAQLTPAAGSAGGIALVEIYEVP